jgi:hypothetical protein
MNVARRSRPFLRGGGGCGPIRGRGGYRPYGNIGVGHSMVALVVEDTTNDWMARKRMVRKRMARKRMVSHRLIPLRIF